MKGWINALNRAQAIIEFHLDGTVITANDNFLKVVGYSKEDIIGKHHKIFCDPEEANSPEYKLFWDKLNHGDYQAGEFRRIGKSGKEIWIIATADRLNI
jgi:methyl-accepting chemotaxis protein